MNVLMTNQGKIGFQLSQKCPRYISCVSVNDLKYGEPFFQIPRPSVTNGEEDEFIEVEVLDDQHFLKTLEKRTMQKDMYKSMVINATGREVDWELVKQHKKVTFSLCCFLGMIELNNM